MASIWHNIMQDR